jgi:hypothetical protein
MKIEIDTQRDSKEQLALLAEFLQKLAGTSGSYSSSDNQFEPTQSEGLFNLFNTNKDETSSDQPTIYPEPEGREEETEERVRIVEY